jgi:Leucine-rich repeat (LRR) protein
MGKLGALLLIFVWMFAVSWVAGQTNCGHYAQLIKDGDAKFKAADFLGAINKYQSAITDCPDSAGAVQPRVLRVFAAIEGLKIVAEKERAKSAIALADVQRQKKISDSLGLVASENEKMAVQKEREADSQREIAEEEVEKNEKLIRAFYFYQGRFALAYGNVRSANSEYYFIDKTGTVVEKLRYWKHAEQFSASGFARVIEGDDVYLLDTLGQRFSLAEDLTKIGIEGYRALDLGAKRLEETISATFRNGDLQVLMLNSNKLTKISDDIGKLDQLLNLQLQGNKIESLPKEIANLKLLQSLAINDNKLGYLPEWIGKLSNLTMLNLAINRLEAIPPTIGNLTKLSHLDLFDNRLKSIPNELKDLQSLKVLNLRENPIGFFPMEILELQNLQSLDFGMGVEISELGDYDLDYVNYKDRRFMRMYNDSIRPFVGKGYGDPRYKTSVSYDSVTLNLQYRIDSFLIIKKKIAHNAMAELPQGLSRLKSLRRLDLSGNQLAGLPSDFGDLPSIQYLSLAGNRFSDLPSDVGKLNTLTSLDLSHNEMEGLPIEFEKLISLTKLSISYNRLMELPPEIAKLKNLEFLMFGFNPCTDTKEEQMSIRDQLLQWLPNCEVVFR